MLSKDHPLVTIAIPTYNRANGFLKQALGSAVNQTYQNLEIIVSDNCSIDNTEKVVNEFSDSRICYFRHDVNIGVNNNFNYCVEQARGDYFLLLHDDDLIDNDLIEVCIKAASNATDIGIIRTGTRVIDDQGKVSSDSQNRVAGLSTEDFFSGWFAFKTSFYLPSTLFNTKKLKKIGGFQSKYNLFQDVAAEVQLAAKFGRVDIKDIKASFRKHSGELTFAAKVKDWCEDSLCLLDLMCSLVQDKDKKMVRNEGMKFFSTLNYNRTRAIKSKLKRFFTYILVFNMFEYKYLPPPVKHILYSNPIYFGLRAIKRKMIT
ncbi:MAG TPA: glycosyltransferase [Ignavibacteria bacterium]|nr:glycosyltransferase [Ignavibacteria bacterium]